MNNRTLVRLIVIAAIIGSVMMVAGVYAATLSEPAPEPIQSPDATIGSAGPQEASVTEPVEEPAAQEIEPNGAPLSLKPIAYLERPTDVVFRLDGTDVYADVRTAILMQHPATGVILWRQVVVLKDLAAGDLASTSLSAKEFGIQLRQKARDGLDGLPVYVRDIRLENLGENLRTDQSGNITALPVTANFSAELRASGTATNGLERAATGSLQPDGTVLWSTRMRVSLAGLAFTISDPATVTFSELMDEVITGVTVLEDL